MRSLLLARRLARTVVLPAGIVSAVSSFSLVDSFVSSGEYSRALALAADCSKPYIPAMGIAPVESEPQFRFASLEYRPAGHELREMYQPATVSEKVTFRQEAGEALALAGNEGTGAEMHSLEADEYAITATSAETMQGCVRVYVGTQTPVLPIGMHDGGVPTSAEFKALATDIKAPAGWTGNVDVPDINPNAISGKMEVLVLKDGKPQPNVDLRVRAVGNGAPGRYGATHGHTHIASGTPAPTLRFNTKAPSANEFTGRTNGQGKYEFTVHPWWRGGPETVLAKAVIDGQTVTGARAVVLRHRRFVSFAQAMGFKNWPTPDERFPFLMTGWTRQHNYNHFIQEGIGPTMAAALRTVWLQDANRNRALAQAAARKQPKPKYHMILNDMSLEYGGRFDVDATSSCTLQTGGGGHASHRAGLDFDINPCYTDAKGGKVGASACEADVNRSAKHYVHIDKRVLTAHVIGRLGGAILAHGSNYDQYLYHYHLRFPEPAVPQSAQRAP